MSHQINVKILRTKDDKTILSCPAWLGQLTDNKCKGSWKLTDKTTITNFFKCLPRIFHSLADVWF